MWSQDMTSRTKAIGSMPEAYPHLILNNFSTKLGQRTANILNYLFPVPKPDTKRIITFANQSDYSSFRHHMYEKHGGPKSIELKEIGTMDQNEAQTEWVIRPYIKKTQVSWGLKATRICFLCLFTSSFFFFLVSCQSRFQLYCSMFF
ncbi:hypothetical protein Pfo_019430 [Paulownia fortunei]|nr:hypothetical protein Pfo_019430 [Paulownia fortunei]